MLFTFILVLIRVDEFVYVFIYSIACFGGAAAVWFWYLCMEENSDRTEAIDISDHDLKTVYNVIIPVRFKLMIVWLR